MGSLNPEDYSVPTGDIDTRTIVKFLWKKFNNTVNALPGDSIEVEAKNFDNTIFLNGLLNKYIPKTIDINSSKNYIFELKNVYNNNIEVSFNINGQIFENKSITSINIDKLRKLDEELDNYDSNYKFSENTYLDLEMFGEQYKYLRYYNKLKLHTIYDRNTINSWSATTPSNEILSNLEPVNIILKNIIPKQYDSSNKNTYNFKLSIDDNDINYFTPDFYYIVDTKNGLVIFLGDISNITSNPDKDFIQNKNGSITLDMDSNVKFSFIKYIGSTGFDDAELSGNIKVDGCLNIFGNLNISGGSLLIDGSNITDYLSTTNGASLSRWSDASFTNVDISGRISIFNNQSYNDISDISNIVLNNQQIKELINYYLSDISDTAYGVSHDLHSFYKKDSSDNVLLSISGLTIDNSYVITLSGQPFNIKDISIALNNLQNTEVSLNFFQDLNNTVQYKFKKFINDSEEHSSYVNIDPNTYLSEWIKANDFSINFIQNFSGSIFEIKAQIQYFTSAATNSLLNIKLVKEYSDLSDDLIEYDGLGGYQLFTQLKNTLNVHYYDNHITDGNEYTYQFYYQLYYLGADANSGSTEISFGFISGSDNSYNNILIREFKYKNENENGNNFYNFYNFYNNYSDNDKILDNNITIQESYKNNFTINNLVSTSLPDISFHDSSYNITFKPINNNNNLLLEYNIFYKNAFQADENISFRIDRYIYNTSGTVDNSQTIINDTALNMSQATAMFSNVYSIFYLDELSKLYLDYDFSYIEYKLLFHIDFSSSLAESPGEGIIANSGNLISIKELKNMQSVELTNYGIYVNYNIFKNYIFKKNLGEDICTNYTYNQEIEALNYSIDYNLTDISNYIILKYKINFECNYNPDERIKFIIKRFNINENQNDGINIYNLIYGSGQMGGSFKNVANIEIIDQPNIINVEYKLYYIITRDDTISDTITDSRYGIIDDYSSNTIFLQEFSDLNQVDLSKKKFSMKAEELHADKAKILDLQTNNIKFTDSSLNSIVIKPPPDISNSYTLTLPTNLSKGVLESDSSGQLKFLNIIEKLYVNSASPKPQTYYEIMTQQPRKFNIGDISNDAASITINWNYEDILGRLNIDNTAIYDCSILYLNNVDNNSQKLLPHIDNIIIELSNHVLTGESDWIVYQRLPILTNEFYNSDISNFKFLKADGDPDGNDIQKILHNSDNESSFDVRVYGINSAIDYLPKSERSIIFYDLSYARAYVPEKPIAISSQLINSENKIRLTYNTSAISNADCSLINYDIFYKPIITNVSSYYKSAYSAYFDIVIIQLSKLLSQNNITYHIPDLSATFNVDISNLHYGTSFIHMIRVKNNLINQNSQYSDISTTIYTPIPISNFSSQIDFNNRLLSPTTPRIFNNDNSINGTTDYYYINNSATNYTNITTSQNINFEVSDENGSLSNINGIGISLDNMYDLVTICAEVMHSNIIDNSQTLIFHGWRSILDVSNSDPGNKFFKDFSSTDMYTIDIYKRGLRIKGNFTLQYLSTSNIGTADPSFYSLTYSATRKLAVNSVNYDSSSTYNIYVDDSTIGSSITGSQGTISNINYKYCMGVRSIDEFDLSIDASYSNVLGSARILLNNHNVGKITLINTTENEPHYQPIDFNSYNSEHTGNLTTLITDVKLEYTPSNRDISTISYNVTVRQYPYNTIYHNQQVYSISLNEYYDYKSYKNNTSTTKINDQPANNIDTFDLSLIEISFNHPSFSNKTVQGLYEYLSSTPSINISDPNFTPLDSTLLYVNGQFQSNSAFSYPVGHMNSYTSAHASASYDLSVTRNSNDTDYKWICIKIDKDDADSDKFLDLRKYSKLFGGDASWVKITDSTNLNIQGFVIQNSNTTITDYANKLRCGILNSSESNNWRTQSNINDISLINIFDSAIKNIAETTEGYSPLYNNNWGIKVKNSVNDSDIYLIILIKNNSNSSYENLS